MYLFFSPGYCVALLPSSKNVAQWFSSDAVEISANVGNVPPTLCFSFFFFFSFLKVTHCLKVFDLKTLLHQSSGANSSELCLAKERVDVQEMQHQTVMKLNIARESSFSSACPNSP